MSSPTPTQTEFNPEPLKARLQGMAEDDPLWPQLLALLEANIRTETGINCLPGLDDGEAHRMRGRVGMLMDFKSDLEKLWTETHPKRANK